VSSKPDGVLSRVAGRWVECSQKHSEGVSFEEEKATLDYLITKIGPKAVCRRLIEFSTMSNGSAPANLHSILFLHWRIGNGSCR
jgi:hypothetical protein